MKISIDEIVDAIELADENSQAFYNADTGKIEWLGDFMDGEEYDELVERIEFGNYISLPSKYDINEYSIMEEYIYSLPTGEVQNKLQSAIMGKGAFRRFKDAVNYLGIAKEWFSFRDETYRSIAVQWCREHGLKERNEIIQ